MDVASTGAVLIPNYTRIMTTDGEESTFMGFHSSDHLKVLVRTAGPIFMMPTSHIREQLTTPSESALSLALLRRPIPAHLVNERDAYGYGLTALLLAVAYHYDDSVAHHLVTHGADLMARDRLCRGVLHLACVRGRSSLTEWLLARNPALIHARDMIDDSPLHEACRSGAWGCVRCCLASGADVNAVNHLGETPLDIAVAHLDGDRALPIVQLLCRFGANREHSAQRVPGSALVGTWLQLTMDCSCPLHYFMCGLISAEEVAQRLRDGDDVHFRRPHNRGPSVYESALRIATSPTPVPVPILSSARLIVEASGPWSFQNAHLRTIGERRIASLLLRVARELADRWGTSGFAFHDVFGRVLIPMVLCSRDRNGGRGGA